METLEMKKEVQDWSQFQHVIKKHCELNKYSDIWQTVCLSLSHKLGQSVFNSWLKQLVPLEIDAGRVKIGTSTGLARDYLMSNYLQSLELAFKETLPQLKAFELIVLTIPSKNGTLGKT